MASNRARLDRVISELTNINRRDVRLLLASGRVLVDAVPARNINQVVTKFNQVSLDGQIIQGRARKYLMLNKPAGVVSATRDKVHRTVVDLLGRSDTDDLHIAGRLDFNSTGLLLLTNDGEWSRGLASPEQGVSKVYQVGLEKPLTPSCVKAFANGMYFAYEGITTRPAGLKILSSHSAQVILTEGRYHQIKRMFGQLDNRVLSLHRGKIGGLSLDETLGLGCSRDLTALEVETIF